MHYTLLFFFTLITFFLSGCQSGSSSTQAATLQTSTDFNETQESLQTTAPDTSDSSTLEEHIEAISESENNLNDPLYSYQWHFDNRGQHFLEGYGGSEGEDINVADVWNTVQGEGIVVAVVDTGIEAEHPDLSDNLNLSKSFRYSDETNTSEPTPSQYRYNSVEVTHGTACAGIIAAQKDNGIGVVGVAPKATLIGLNVFSDNQDSSFFSALSREDVDVSSNSWGNSSSTLFRDDIVEEAIVSTIDTSREGNGTVYVFASGNYNTNANFYSVASLPYVIVVSATDSYGLKASYSNYGSNVFITAPGGFNSVNGEYRPSIVTTDIQGFEYGYDSYEVERTSPLLDAAGNENGDYTMYMTGTSAATPMVSGAAALLLSVNPSLSYRDIKYILASTARQNDAQDESWYHNAAGFSISEKYGFGMLDVSSAVNKLSQYTPLPEAKYSDFNRSDCNLTIPETSQTSQSCEINSTALLTIEHVMVTVDIDADAAYSLMLISPQNTQTVLLHDSAEVVGSLKNWRYGVTQLLDERADGVWKLKLTTLQNSGEGVLNGFSIKIFGY